MSNRKKTRNFISNFTAMAAIRIVFLLTDIIVLPEGEELGQNEVLGVWSGEYGMYQKIPKPSKSVHQDPSFPINIQYPPKMSSVTPEVKKIEKS